MLQDFFENLTGTWSDRLKEAGVDVQPPLSALQLGGDRGNNRKINLLLFGSHSKQPLLILKLSRSSGYEMRLQQEFQALQNLSKIAEIRSTVPAAIGLFPVGSHMGLLETCLPGTALTTLLKRHKHRTAEEVKQDLFRMRQWLEIFQAASSSGTVFFPGAYSAMKRLEATEKEVAVTFPESFTRSLKQMGNTLEGFPLPCSARHGDFWPGNFLLKHNRVGVIDWEELEENQWPFHDLFLFLVTYSQIYPWSKWQRTSKIESFRIAFLSRNWFSQIIRSCVQTHFEKMLLPKQAMHFFFSLFLLDQASSDNTRALTQQRTWIQILKTYAANVDQSIFLMR